MIENLENLSEDFFQVITNNTSVGIICIDESDRVVFVNDTLARVLGYSKEEISLKINQGDISLSLDDNYINLQLKSGGTLRSEISSSKTNHGTRIVSVSFKEAIHSEFEDSDKFYKIIIDLIPDIVSVQDKENRVLFYNKAGYEFLNLSEKDIVGKNCYSLIGRKTVCKDCPSKKCIKEGKEVAVERFFPDLRKWYKIRAYPIKDIDGEVIKVIEHLRDITLEKAYESEVRSAKNDWQATFQAIGHPAFILDSNKKVLDVNSALEKKTGKTRKELIGKTCCNILFKDSNCNESKHCPINKVIKSNRFETSTKNIKMLGGVHVSSCTPILNEEGNLDKIIYIATDVNQLKEVESELFESQQKLSHLMENTPGVVYRCNLDKDWTMSFISKGIKELTGYESDSIVDNLEMTFSEIIHPEDRESVYQSINRQLSKKSNFVCEYRLITKTGRVKYVWDRGNVFDDKKKTIDGVIIDITARKKMEISLKRSEEKHRLLVENQNELLVKVDNHGRFKYASDTYCQIFGKPEAELLGKSFMPLVHEDDRALTNSAMSRLKYYPHTCYIEQRAMTANGWRWFAWSDKAIVDNNGDVIEIIGVGRDITERKIIEFELIKSKEKAEESDKLKSAFITNLSHELRSPMNGLIGFSELITQTDTTKEERINYANTILSSCNQLLKIVNDLIDISRIETNQTKLLHENIEINGFLDEVYSFHYLEANSKGIELLLDKQSNTPLVISSDFGKIQQIITNLITNSLKFTFSGYVKLGYSINGSEIHFYVEDTGKGIPKSEQELVFERFRQAGNDNVEFGGTGLGLSISKSYVELLGGRISLDSEVGKGTVVSFVLPLDSTATMEGKSKGEQVNVIDLTGVKILIAEDEQINFQLLRTILTKVGAEVIHAESGLEAVQFVEEDDDISLILMDIKMPGLTGSEALKRIKKIKSDIPIIACTAYVQTEGSNFVNEEGFDAYIPKPIKRARLYKTINTILSEKK